MVEKMSAFTDQNTVLYIKNRCILGMQAKDIFNEICRVDGNNELSFFHLSDGGVRNLKAV